MATLAPLLFAIGLASSFAPKTAVFSMYCYWTGEAALDRVPGVLETRIGEWDGEVVEVTYDASKTNPHALSESLMRSGGYYALVARDAAEEREALRLLPREKVRRLSGQPTFLESKYSLRTTHPEIWGLGLTEAQAIALNAWSYFGGPMPDVLTREQKAKLLKR
jgi:hypothetical protein